MKRPERRGFGLQAIERILGYELSGRAQVEFHPGGLSCRIEVPARELVGCVDDEAREGALEPAPVPLPGSSRRRSACHCESSTPAP